MKKLLVRLTLLICYVPLLLWSLFWCGFGMFFMGGEFEDYNHAWKTAWKVGSWDA